MLPTVNDLEESVENLGKKAVKQFKQQVNSTVKSTAQQVTGGSQNDPTAAGSDVIMPQVDSNQDTKDFVSDLYAPSAGGTQQSQQNGQAATGQDPNAQQQEALKNEQLIKQLRAELHKNTYYDPTFNRPKNVQEEESVVEKQDRETEEMEWLEQKKEQEKPPALDIEVTRAEK